MDLEAVDLSEPLRDRRETLRHFGSFETLLLRTGGSCLGALDDIHVLCCTDKNEEFQHLSHEAGRRAGPMLTELLGTTRA